MRLRKSLGGRPQMTEPVSFPGALKIGLAGLAATLLLSVQVKTSAQQGDAASAGPSPPLRASVNSSIAIARRAITNA